MIARNLKQNITHWTTTPTGDGGLTFGVPITIKGRWEDKQVLFRDGNGEEVTSEAVVYLATDVSINDYLFLGTAVDANPTFLDETRLVRQFHKTPDLRNLVSERKAFL